MKGSRDYAVCCVITTLHRVKRGVFTRNIVKFRLNKAIAVGEILRGFVLQSNLH